MTSGAGRRNSDAASWTRQLVGGSDPKRFQVMVTIEMRSKFNNFFVIDSSSCIYKCIIKIFYSSAFELWRKDLIIVLC